MKKIHLTLIAALFVIAALVAGCLTTGTVVVTARLSPDDDGNAIRIQDWNYSVAELEVNLNNNATFKDYRDDIRNIDNIGFYLAVTNHEFDELNFQLFLEPDTSVNYDSLPALIDSLPELILTGLLIPGDQSVTVNWNQSMQYITNLDLLKDVLETGVFSLYPAVIPRPDFDITLDSLVVIVTLTGTK